MKKYLSIDIGGSSTKYALIEESFSILKKGTEANTHKNIEEFVNQIERIYNEFEAEISGLAISMAGTINSDSGLVILSGAFDYLRGYNIHDLLSGFCNVPISIENDANCAALAELKYGNLKNVKDAVVVLLGSSIGGAIINNGKITHGNHYSAGEFSLIKTNGTDTSLHQLWRNCNGKNGLLRLVQKHMKTDKYYNGVEIFEMAKQGNGVVKEAIDEFTRLLAIQLYNIQAFFDPEAIAIGGGISSEPLLFDSLNKNLSDIFENEKQYHLAIVNPHIVPCLFKNDSNLIGALSHYFDKNTI